ncbi:MAG: DUF370 domain-containing protein [Acutalibacteraceae bacterium]|nr:DUF370 domain-containing protein [Acutalibacteraceae bacterium]
MYLHLGHHTVITHDEIIGIFDLDSTTVAKKTRDYLSIAQKEGRVREVSYELPKSFIVCREKDGRNIVYLSQISTSTLLKRTEEGY